MSSTGIMEQVRTLLAQGKTSTEVIAMGYRAGTVYKSQRQLAEGGMAYGPHREKPQVRDPKPSEPSKVGVPHHLQTLDPEVEADPEIRKLKVRLRKAQLEREIAEQTAPEDLDNRVAALENGMEEIFAEIRGLDPYVFGNPVANLRDEFRCACGFEDQMAAKVVCTACGVETEYSWWNRLN